MHDWLIYVDILLFGWVFLGVLPCGFPVFLGLYGFVYI